MSHDADIMEELKGLTPEQLKALIAMVKKSENLGGIVEKYEIEKCLNRQNFAIGVEIDLLVDKI